MTQTNARTPTMKPRDWGLSDDDLATASTVYRQDLLAGKVFLITGAGSGIGRATAYLASRLGAEVMICGRRVDKLHETAGGIRKRIGSDIALTAMTIRDPEQVSRLVDATFERFGRIDHLVNCAGGQFPQNALDYSAKGWNAVIGTNLNGTWHMMQAVARRWSDRGDPGNIVSIETVFERGMPQSAHSCAARAAVAYLSKSLAVEWAALGIRLNCIAPGTIESTGFNNYPEELLGRLDRLNPMMRAGDVWDIAEAIVYLCAPSGKFITGELLHVDGGSRLWGEMWPLGTPGYFKGPDNAA